MTPANHLSYTDFDLLIDGSAGHYRAQVIDAVMGRMEVTFENSFSKQELESFYQRLGYNRRALRRLNSDEMEAARYFGKRLFDTVFKDELLNIWRTTFSQNSFQEGLGLRIRLHLEAGELSSLPWEYLYYEPLDSFLALGRNTPLVRYLDLPLPPPVLAVHPPLHMLVMISNPEDAFHLDIEREWSLIQKALSGAVDAGLIQVERLERADLSTLQHRLQNDPPVQILHFMGHGRYDREHHDGCLLFEDECGKAQLLSGVMLGAVLHNHPALRLVVLNVCEGARTSPEDPFAGVAQSLIQQGIPAVVAMQFEISDQAAIAFAHEFYSVLAKNFPLDRAMVEARVAIHNLGDGVEWGTPVYFSRAPDGRIFDIEQTSPLLSPAKLPAQLPLDPELEQRLERFYTNGLAAEVSRQWKNAARIYRSILQVHPDYQDVPTHLAEVERQLELSRLYAQAQLARQKCDWSVAYRDLQQLVALEPGYRDAAALLKNAGLEVELARLYDQARRLYQGQRWSESLTVLGQIYTLQSDYPDPEGLEQRARQALETEERQTDLYLSGWDALEVGQWELAIERFERLLAEALDYSDASDLLQQARDGLAAERQAEQQKLYLLAQDFMQVEEWKSAIQVLNKLLAVAADYPGAAELLQHARESYKAERQPVLQNLCRQAEVHMKVGRWQQAIALLEDVLADVPNFPNAAELLQQAQDGKAAADRHQVELRWLYSQAQGAMRPGRWQEAILLLEYLLTKAPRYPNANNLLQKARGAQAAELKIAASQKRRENIIFTLSIMLLVFGGGVITCLVSSLFRTIFSP